MKPLETLVAPSSEYYNFSPSQLAREHLLHVLCVGDFRYKPGYDLARTSFDSYLMEVILDGSLQIETEGECLSAHAGQVVLIDCAKPHRYHSDTGWRALWVHFDGAGAKGYYSLILRQNGRVFSTHKQQRICERLHAILNVFSKQLPLSETQMALHLTQALTDMAEPAAPEGVRDRYRLIDQAVLVIRESLGNEPSVAQLARQVGLSEYHFIRVFREVMGVTPHQYVIAARMDHARYLLKTTGLPICEIGSKVGYQSESMFSAAFRRTQGMAPSVYRLSQNP